MIQVIRAILKQVNICINKLLNSDKRGLRKMFI
jgi:hypothetical protein